MGTSVATELLARDLEPTLSFTLAGVLLQWQRDHRACVADLGADRSALNARGHSRGRNRRVYVRRLACLFSASHPLSDAEAQDQWVLWSRAGGGGPAAPVTELPQRGHYPQIEQAQAIAVLVKELVSTSLG